ncbi:nickel-responsive transcriptional regulator NikR [Methylobacterium sp. DB0501]|uniref:nickel-responsive transcriptional regulator NikR n=1 Tax=Methylobacterium sp. DB0501 TaxID=2709665 RepID=UPI0013ED8377|nr:nickel-responsive transcriptional regulator NikR [Methylobacterium sp. DB0501]NGM35482.1 nickel-responsive transcriptional regulator NikR [Methylobacterium sp. DB0501]
MQRITVTLDPDLVAEVDRTVEQRGYAGRSEAMRDLLRRGLAETRRRLDPDLSGIATFTFVAEAGVRDLGQRLAEVQQRRHDLVVAQIQIPLDHEASLHTLLVRGRVRDILAFVDEVATQRGIRHDSLSLIPARIELGAHRHGEDPHPHEHIRT